MKAAMKKTIGVLIALILMLGMLPATAFAASHSITVTTDGHGTAAAPANAEEGDMIVWINLTPDDGYVFDSCTATGIAEGDIGSTYSVQYSAWPVVGICIYEMPGNDISFHVTFAEAVTVTYDANGGIPGDLWSDSTRIKKGTTEALNIFDAEIISPPEGMDYDGVKINGERFGPTDPYTYNANASIVYQWKHPNVHTVLYDCNGGTSIDGWSNSFESVTGEELTLPTEEDVLSVVTPPEGQELVGFEIDRDGKVHAPGETYIMPDHDITVKALWRDITPKITVSFDLNGGTKGSGWADSIELTVGSTESVPESSEPMAIAPEGKEYAGMEIGGVEYAPGAEYTVPDHAVTAKFMWKDHIHSYTDELVAPTCTEKGFTRHSCEGCGDTYTDSFVDALGHKDADKDGKCDLCGGDLSGRGDKGRDMKSPKTGDSAQVLTWLSLMLLSGASLVCTVMIGRKKADKR